MGFETAITIEVCAHGYTTPELLAFALFYRFTIFRFFYFFNLPL